jgi:hypothetical protein
VLGYRSFFSVEPQVEFARVIESEFADWLKSKQNLRLDDMSPGRHQLADDGTVVEIVSSTSPDGSQLGRFRLQEASGWTTVLTTEHGPHTDPWIWLDVHGPDHRRWTGTPRLARQLLATFDARDGSATLRDHPMLIGQDSADQVVEVICDPDRRGLVFVAGSSEDLPWGPWSNKVGSLLAETVGLSASYLLDPLATKYLADLLGSSHATPAAAIRSYLPEADPADPVDGRRHRVLSTARIAGAASDLPLRRMLGGAARRGMLEQPLPSRLNRVDRLLRRQLAQSIADLVPAATPVAAPAGGQSLVIELTPTAEPLAARALTGLVEAVLGTAEYDETSLDEIARLAHQGRASQNALATASQSLLEYDDLLGELQTENARLQTALDDAQLDEATQLETNGQLRDQIRYLQIELSKAGRGELAWAEIPADDVTTAPGQISDIWDKLGELRHVVVTADRETAESLDDHDQLGNIASKVWTVLLALDDYAEARRLGVFNQGVHPYLRETPSGYRSYSAQGHAASESTLVRTNQKFREQRVFSVPRSIDPDGRTFMEAHFKLGAKRSLSPRLYYLDATQVDGKVYIGYLGPHLPNSKTN